MTAKLSPAFYVRTTVFNGAHVHVEDVRGYPTFDLAQRGLPFVVVTEDHRQSIAGLYWLDEQGQWRLVLPFAELCAGLFAASAIQVWIKPAADVELPEGSKVWRSGAKIEGSKISGDLAPVWCALVSPVQTAENRILGTIAEAQRARGIAESALQTVVDVTARVHDMAELVGRAVFVDQRGTAGGVTPLNEDAQIPLTHLPAALRHVRGARESVIANRALLARQVTREFTNIASRAVYQALDTSPYMKLLFANFTSGEEGTGNDLKVAAWLEYPIGVVASTFTFDGAPVGTIKDLEDALTDELKIEVPEGSYFAVHTYVEGTLGVPYFDDMMSFAGDYAYFGTAEAAASSEVGTLTTPGGQLVGGSVGFRPTAVLGLTAKAVIGIAGDQRLAVAVTDQVDDMSGATNPALRSLVGVPTFTVSHVGQKLEDALSTGFTWRLQYLASYCSSVITNLGGLDIIEGTNEVKWEPMAHLFVEQLGGTPVWWTTIPPGHVVSTDGFTSAENQTVHSTDGVRQAVNNLIRQGICFAGAPSIKGFIEIADAVELLVYDGQTNRTERTGKWKFDRDHKMLWTRDGFHESPWACKVIATSSAFAPVVRPRFS